MSIPTVAVPDQEEIHQLWTTLLGATFGRGRWNGTTQLFGAGSHSGYCTNRTFHGLDIRSS